MKIYAMVMTYEQMDWLPWTVNQFDKALSFGSIDKVLIAEGGHSKKVPVHSTDGSWEYLQNRVGKDDRYKLFDVEAFRKNSSAYGDVQYRLLAHMCEEIPLDGDSWIWCIHDDEFFFDEFLKNIRNIAVEARTEGKEMVMTRQMGFSFNFRLYWNKRTAYMLYSWNRGNYWKPITTPCYPDGATYLGKKNKIKFDPYFEHITFHFSHVKRPKRQTYRHSVLPSELGLDIPTRWHKEIWEKADLNNLKASYENNRAIMGGYGFYRDTPDLGPEVFQPLSVYNGPYPEVLHDHPYRNIEDIRKVG